MEVIPWANKFIEMQTVSVFLEVDICEYETRHNFCLECSMIMNYTSKKSISCRVVIVDEVSIIVPF